MNTAEARHYLTVTDAPVRYDGFGTTTVSVLAINVRSERDVRVVRMVITREEHLEWQRSRYASGLFMHLTEEAWNDLWVTTYSEDPHFAEVDGNEDIPLFSSENFLAQDTFKTRVQYVLDDLRERDVVQGQEACLDRVTGSED